MDNVFGAPSAPDLPPIQDRDPTALDPVAEANLRRQLTRQRANNTVASLTIPRDVPLREPGVGTRPPSTT
jgi:hypothetical protein